MMLGDGKEREGERLLSYGKEEWDQKKEIEETGMRRCQEVTERKRERG